MKEIKLNDSEIQSLVDILLFKSIIKDESESVIDIIHRFGIDANHRILGLCEPMSYISQNFLEISQNRSYGYRYRNRWSSINALSMLEEQTYKEFCSKGIHPLELAIKIDALSVFHALLDIGHKDFNTQATHLCIRHLRPDMLSRLQEEGFDLWQIHPEWECRPIDTLLMMISFKEELPIVSISDLVKKLAECFEIIVKSASLENMVNPNINQTFEQNGDSWSIVRKRKSAEELGNIFYNCIHGVID
jgi:hypothetical protein